MRAEGLMNGFDIYISSPALIAWRAAVATEQGICMTDVT